MRARVRCRAMQKKMTRWAVQDRHAPLAAPYPARRVGEKQLRAPTLNGAVGAGQWEPHMCVDGVPITRPKKRQLRDRITTNWLASHRGYRCTVQDMWAVQEAAKLDRQASTEAVWGTAGGGGRLHLEQALRARCLELMRMHPGRTREVTNRLRQAETCSLLCALEGNWFHICSMCTHPDMRDFYTVRHNAVGRTLLHAMRQGKLGRWLTLTSFGRVDNQAEQQTVPEWMLPAADKAAL